MTLSQLVYRSMLKNMKHYYLYFFALIFSVTLYFSFITLQFNKSVLAETRNSGTATAGFEVATYLLYFIVLVFVIYANHLFMKRRSKELGLYQLIGMTKGLIFRLLVLENVLLFGGAVLTGIAGGFLSSRLFAMILLKLLGRDLVVGLTFSLEAVGQTLLFFGGMLLIILVQLFIFIKRQTLLEMFQASNKADESVRKFSVFQMLMGVVGLALIIYGYYASTILFEGEGNKLALDMGGILATTIGGTFLVFRYSVALLINMWRMKKNGFVSRTDVVALTPIMHRMKSNAKSLTLITVLTAVSLGINTLAYIAYYSSEKNASMSIPADYVLKTEKADKFLTALEKANIKYDKKVYEYGHGDVPFHLLLKNPEEQSSAGYYVLQQAPIVAASNYGADLTGNKAIITGYYGYSADLFDVVANREVTLSIYGEKDITIFVTKIDRKPLLAKLNTNATTPIVVVSDELFAQLARIEGWLVNKETHVTITDKKQLATAEKLYKQSGADVFMTFEDGHERKIPSYETLREENMQSLGLTIFVTAFLGLAFLLASGSILYFKQMSEADSESGSYTILRKIGYSQQDLLRGIYMKQLFNFGVPVSVGLLHSYFAVKSGWWLFGTELVVPMIIMMLLYVAIYIVFALLTIQYYKKVIKAAL